MLQELLQGTNQQKKAPRLTNADEMLAIVLGFGAAAFTPVTSAHTRTVPAASSRRPGELRCGATEPSGRRTALFAAAAAAMLPAAAHADYLTKEEEDGQKFVLVLIGATVILSPIIGIQSARTMISKFKDEDDTRFSQGGDPEWGATPSAKKNKRQRELQAQLQKEENTKGWFK